MTRTTQEAVENIVSLARQYEAALQQVPEYAPDIERRLDVAKRELLAALSTQGASS